METKFTKKKIVSTSILIATIAICFGLYYYSNQSPVDNSKLEKLMQSPNPIELKQTTKKLNVKKSPTEKVGASESDIRFVVSRDFNAVAACANILSNSLNKEVQTQWMEQRLNLAAQRERTRVANLNLEEQESSFKALQLRKKEEALKNAKVDGFNFGGFLKGDAAIDGDQPLSAMKESWPSIYLQSITESDKATFSIDGKLFIDRKEGDYFEKYQLSKVEYDTGCISFVGSDVSTQFKRVCM